MRLVDFLSASIHAANATNKQVEDAAVSYVIVQEAAAGRLARDTRGQGAGDLSSGERIIEVKAYGKSARGQDLWLEARQADEARRNDRFWLYIVDNVRQGDPGLFHLLRIGGEPLRVLLARARERRYYEVPLSVAQYDALRAEWA